MGRETLYKKFNEKGFKIGAEIGVQYGINAVGMFKHIPGLKLYLVDSWSKNKRYDAARAYVKAERSVSPYNAVIIYKKSMLAALDVPDKSLDFVYIDADHSYNAVMLDVILWSQKVRDGGMISGHDYYRHQPGVKNAIDDYVRYHKIDLQIYRGHNWSWET